MTSTQQRAELQRRIWQIANYVRGAVDGWDFKQYVLGTLFYRFISENFIDYITGGDASVDYAAMADDDESIEAAKDDAIKTKGYFIYPSQLFVEDVGKALVYLGERQAVTGGHATILKPGKCLLGKYFAYFTQTDEFSSEKRKYAKGAKVIDVSATDMAKIRIPIPCPDNLQKSLEFQAEIVRILDAFTSLTAELTARKKQYNHYRDKLLRFEDGEVEWRTLGDVTKKWYSGGTPTAGKPEYYDGGDIPWLRTQEVKFSDIESTEVKITQKALENSAAKWIPANCVIIAISGATAGRSAINKIPLTTNQHCGCLEIDGAKALYRYVFHWVSFNYGNIKALGQGARGDLNSSIIKGFRLPIPYADDPEKSLAEQARIVAILDKFDALTNSITEGLPREIELRQKQYEYYRDLLLSFPKPDEVTA